MSAEGSWCEGCINKRDAKKSFSKDDLEVLSLVKEIFEGCGYGKAIYSRTD